MMNNGKYSNYYLIFNPDKSYEIMDEYELDVSDEITENESDDVSKIDKDEQANAVLEELIANIRYDYEIVERRIEECNEIESTIKAELEDITRKCSTSQKSVEELEKYIKENEKNLSPCSDEIKNALKTAKKKLNQELLLKRAAETKKKMNDSAKKEAEEKKTELEESANKNDIEL